MFKLIKSNEQTIEKIISDGAIVWKVDEPNFGLDEADLIYSKVATFRVSNRDISFSLGPGSYSKMKNKRKMVINNKVFDISNMGISNINQSISFLGNKFNTKKLYNYLSSYYAQSVGSMLYNSKDNKAHIKIYK